MAQRWWVWTVTVACVVACALPYARAQAKCFVPPDNAREGTAMPNFNATLNQGSYSLIVELTRINEKTTYYVEEVHERRLYHDEMRDTVAVKMEVNGTKVIYHFLPESNTFVEEREGVCRKLEQAPDHLYGWYDTDASHGLPSFGPSSILRLSQFLPAEYVDGDGELENVQVQLWRVCTDDGNVEIQYAFSRPPWIMPGINWFPDQMDTLPVAMELHLMDDSTSDLYTFVDFVPFVTSHSLLEPPRGMSCEGLVGMAGSQKVPSIPKHFSMAQESVVNSYIDGKDYGNQYMTKEQLTYAGDISLISMIATMPFQTMIHTAFAVKIIQDFNTGVQYTIFKEFGNCSIDRISYFGGGYIGGSGVLQSPNGLFHLDDTYAFVGERISRFVNGDLWTSTRIDDIPDPVTGGLQNFEKAVMEYYFTQSIEKSPSGTLNFTNIPFRGDVFIYNKSDPLQIVNTATSNMYDFKVIEIYSPEEFAVEECFEKYSDDWSYLDIFFPAKKSNQMSAAAQDPDRFKHEVMKQLIHLGQLSPVRISSVDINTGLSGILPNTTNADMVVAKIKLLERAPYIYSFRQPADEEDHRPGNKEIQIPNIRFKDDCAYLCATNASLNCKSFHHCQNEVCYFSPKDLSDGAPINITSSTCEHWVYDITNKTVEDYPSKIVFNTIYSAIRSGDFKFRIPYKNKQNKTIMVDYEASYSLDYRTPDPLDPLRKEFTLEATMMTVRNPDDTLKVADLTECMLFCVNWSTYRCETIIHLVKEGQCLILATHYTDLDQTELVPHSESFVHSRSYMVDYSPILGGVAINTTGPSYSNVDHLESCARYCSKETEIDCQSFEYCPLENVCHLHKEHYLDVVEGGDYETGTSCIHFSKKSDSSFTKYANQGLDYSKHKLVAQLSNAEACAKLCMKDLDEMCESYDLCGVCNDKNSAVCGEEHKKQLGLCFLSTHHLGEPGLKLTSAPQCDHYSRDKFGDLDYAGWVAQQRQSDKPYTSGSMAGLAFGMIFLGILLALLTLVLLTTLKPTSVPKDFEINFVSLKSSSGDSSI